MSSGRSTISPPLSGRTPNASALHRFEPTSAPSNALQRGDRSYVPGIHAAAHASPGGGMSRLHPLATSDPALKTNHAYDQKSAGSSGEDSRRMEEQDLATPHEPTSGRTPEDYAPNALPAWTEMKTKAGKDRKRLPLACIACRRKKIRCSGEQPACKHCLRSRIPCVYKITTRKAAPRTDYMAMLDKRLKRMEERVIKVIPKEQQGIVASTGRATLKPSAIPALRRGSTTKKRVAEQSVADLEKWARGEDSRPVSRNNDLMPPSRAGLRSHDSDEQSLLKEGVEDLPPKEIQEHLSEVFFDYVYGQSYHLLHKPSFMRKLAQDQIAPVLLLAVCAMAARFSHHPAVQTEPAFLRGERWAEAAREISLKRYDSPNITILIVYLILTLHEFGTCQGGRSWMFGGMAQRMAYALQLHQDLEFDPQRLQNGEKVRFSDTDREIRRRTMWACFLMDRFCSSGTERPTFVTTEHIHARLPIAEKMFTRELQGCTEDLAGNVVSTEKNESLTDATENMGVAAYTIRLIAIWGEAISYYNLGGKQKDPYTVWDDRSSFQRMRQKLKSWGDKLPERLRYNAGNLAAHAAEKIANQFIFMHIIFHQTTLFITKFALPTPSAKAKSFEQMPAAFTKECAKAAWISANKVSMLVRDGMAHNVVAPFAGYSAFFSGAVHIQGTFSKSQALQASSKQHLTWNINYLTKMKKHWGMFHFMTENLRDLYRKLADQIRNATQHPETEAGSESDGIFQYGDWFDRYPHGVSGSGFDSPSDASKREPGADAGLGQQGDLHTVEEFFATLSPSSVQVPSATKARRHHKRYISRSNSTETNQEAQQHLNSSPFTNLHNLPHLRGSQPYNQADLGQDPSDYPRNMSAIINEARELGSMSYVDTQAVVNSMTGYQAELSALAANAITPFSGASGMSYGIPGVPMMPLQSSYAGSTSGAWFMPYNMEPPGISQSTGALGEGPISWSSQYAELQTDLDQNAFLGSDLPPDVIDTGHNGTV